MELIDKEQAYKELSEYYHHNEFIQHQCLAEALDRVPVVDAQPVIRCMDCKWFGAWYCDLLHFGIVDLHKYCAWAERKEE